MTGLGIGYQVSGKIRTLLQASNGECMRLSIELFENDCMWKLTRLKGGGLPGRLCLKSSRGTIDASIVWS